MTSQGHAGIRLRLSAATAVKPPQPVKNLALHQPMLHRRLSVELIEKKPNTHGIIANIN
jgi:hypothetical protein